MLKDIRESVSSLRTLNPAASPTAMMEGFNRIAELHRQVAEAQVTDPKVGWDCSRLHEELNQIEKNWVAAIEKPKQEVARLSEDRKKLLAVAEATAEAAKVYRKVLTETVAKASKKSNLFEQMLKRGQGWQQAHTGLSKKVATLEHDQKVKMAALEIIAEKFTALKAEHAKLQETYHADTTKLARKVVEQRHADKITAEVKKQLAECKTATEVLKLQETIAPEVKAEEPKAETVVTPVATDDAAKTEEKKDVTTESKKPAPTSVTEGLYVVRADDRKPNTLSESILIAQRMNANRTAA